MAGCGLPRTSPRAPSFSSCCVPTARRLLVLYDESTSTTSCLVPASDADEIMRRSHRHPSARSVLCNPCAAIVRSCIFPSSLPGSESCQLKAPSLEKSTRDTPSSLSNAMPRPECRSAGLKSMKQSSCAAFGLAVKLPAESAAAGSGPCYAKAQTSPRDRERRGAFPGHTLWHVRDMPAVLSNVRIQG